ncbi:hypothetical protein VEx25_1328 [Vibrio antiquarius]|uniref:Uncharacterized protein n=1 Tax=Vibrio antiquarius (strain Ex25) TaxID=150340 RepID=A0ABM9WVP5_VIBAE|nr:hypothetical protein VEx25_1328 [Vibrio antiquarius]
MLMTPEEQPKLTTVWLFLWLSYLRLALLESLPVI